MNYFEYFLKKKNKFRILALGCFLIFGTILVAEIPQKEFFYNESDIIEDSEIGYIFIPHDLLTWDRKEVPPNKVKAIAVCKKGKVHILAIGMWRNGNWMDSRSEEIFQKRASLKKYLRLWREIQKYDVWNLESPMEILARIKTPEEDPYEDWATSQSRYEFILKIKYKEHKFEVYYIQGLKDKRYLSILNEMNRLFQIKGIQEIRFGETRLIIKQGYVQ